MKIENFVLIIGAMKCGTTTLFDLMAQHPEICPCNTKEPGFFAFEDRWAEGFKWYESLYDFDVQSHRYALEASTDYTKFPFANGVVDRLDESDPRRFKLIYVIRDPIDRIESHARHTQLRGKELGQHLSPRLDHSLDEGVSPVSLAASRYLDQIFQYKKYIDQENLLIITLDGLSENPNQTLKKIWAFLDLEPCEEVIIQASNQFSEKREIPEFFNLVRQIIPFRRYLRAMLGNSATDRFINSWRRPPDLRGRFKFTDEERIALKASFCAEYELLSRLGEGEDFDRSFLLSGIYEKTASLRPQAKSTK